jgi:SAM-dependent methyltransferase
MAEVETTRPCPVCDAQRAEVLHAQRFVLADDKRLAQSYTVVACAVCGAAFADTPVSQREYDELYARRSRYAAGPAAHAVSGDRDIGRFRDMAAAIANAVPERGARMVDIGCANGQMLAALAEYGYTSLTGVDPSPACVAQAGAIPGVRALVGSLSDMPAGEAPFDVVILSHVLEHVRDVKPALASLEPFMTARARLYVEVPDASRYAAFAWSPFQDFNSEHINHFSLVSLDNLLRQVGFRGVDAGAKDILSAPGMPYPAIYALAERDPAVPRAARKDTALGLALRDYVEVSTRLMRDIDRRLARDVSGGRPVIVWGTGELTAKLLADTALGQANIEAFVDSNPVNQGQRLHGVQILAPDQLASGRQPIVVASILHHRSIVQAIRARGLENPIVALTPDAV